VQQTESLVQNGPTIQQKLKGKAVRAFNQAPRQKTYRGLEV